MSTRLSKDRGLQQFSQMEEMADYEWWGVQQKEYFNKFLAKFTRDPYQTATFIECMESLYEYRHHKIGTQVVYFNGTELLHAEVLKRNGDFYKVGYLDGFRTLTYGVAENVHKIYVRPSRQRIYHILFKHNKPNAMQSAVIAVREKAGIHIGVVNQVNPFDLNYIEDVLDV